ncbi:hypothetical protein [Streptococcus merionis]
MTFLSHLAKLVAFFDVQAYYLKTSDSYRSMDEEGVLEWFALIYRNGFYH